MGFSIHDQLPEDDPRQPTWKEQRLDYGFDDTELWNLDNVFAKFIYPRLIRFRYITESIPSSLNEKEWDTILSKMTYSFGVLKGDRIYFEEEEEKKIKEGLELFSKYYFDLWM